MATDPQSPHLWFTPHDIAALLDARKHGNHWRAKCPAHGGDNPSSLAIREGRDKSGLPCTLLHCFAHNCTVEDICKALGMPVRNLFCMAPEYEQATRHMPRAKSPRINKLRECGSPSPDDIAQVLLEEMIVSDPPWIQECRPAREKLWALAKASPKSKAAFTRALQETDMNALVFWDTLTREMNG